MQQIAVLVQEEVIACLAGFLKILNRFENRGHEDVDNDDAPAVSAGINHGCRNAQHRL